MVGSGFELRSWTRDLNPGLCCVLNVGRINPFLYSVKISNLPLILVGIGSGVQVRVTPKQLNSVTLPWHFHLSSAF